jgi:CreA protein
LDRIGSEAVSSIAPQGAQNIAFASASLFFKTFEIHRAVDAENNVLVYTVVSTKPINGSPSNSISVLPVEAW